MANTIQIRRGTNAIGTQLLSGELGFKTDTNELGLGTGAGSPDLRISLWDEYTAQSILAATSADTPAALEIAEQRVVGRITAGNVAALTGANLWTILTGQAGADLAMNSKKITGVTDPTSAQDAATKSYVDSVATGLSVHTAVACASTEDLTLSGEQTIDGILTSESRVLAKDQTDASENGIYVTAAGAWARAADMDAAAEFPSSFVFVSAGTTLKDTGWVCTNEPEGIVVDTTNITFAQFSGAGYVSAGTGLTKAGNVISATGGLADIAGLAMTKGNLIVGDADGDDWAALGVGTDTHVLTADAASANGVKWAAVAAGATTFVALTDTPANFTDASLKFLRVNVGADAVEFFTPKVGDLSDVDAFAGAGADQGKIVRVKTASDALEFVAFASTYLEGTPTEDLATKAPTSEWAFDHAAAATGVHGAGAATLLHSGSTIDGGTLA